MAPQPHTPARTRRRRGPALVAAVLLALGTVGIATPALLPVADAAPSERLDVVMPAPEPSPSPHTSTASITRRAAAPPSPAPSASPTPAADTASPPKAPRRGHHDPGGDDGDDPGDPDGGTGARPEADVQMERKVVDLVNRRRAEAGCGRLRLDYRLSRASVFHSRDMAEHDYFSHTGNDGSSPWDRAKRQGYQNPRSENLAAGHRTPAEVVQGWMDSAGHRKNIVDCTAKAVGVGLARGGSYGIYWTQMFGTV